MDGTHQRVATPHYNEKRGNGMSTAQELHVVLGARGGVGLAVVRLLAEQGKLVRAVSRGKAEALVGTTIRTSVFVAASVANPSPVRASIRPSVTLGLGK